MLCKFQAATSHFYFSCKMKCWWNRREVVAAQSRAHCFTQYFYHSLVWDNGLWLKIWHRNKTACSELNPVQSSRSKSKTCLRKGRLLKLELNSPATSDGGAQNLGNEVRRDSESIATKVAAKSIAMKCNVWRPCSDQCWQDKLWFSIYYVTEL